MMIGTTSRRERSIRATSWPVGPGAERDVEQHDVERPLRGGLERGLAVGDRGHAVALALERARQHLAQRVVVVDEQDLQRRRGQHLPGQGTPGTSTTMKSL